MTMPNFLFENFVLRNDVKLLSYTIKLGEILGELEIT